MFWYDLRSYMEITEVIKNLLDERSLVVQDKTVEPYHIDRLRLETGELIYWVKDGQDIWLAIDESSEEIILFNEVEALDIDFSQESLFYSGDDYELTSEIPVVVVDDDTDEEEEVILKDYDRGDGQFFRVMEYTVSGEIITLVGWKVAEEEIQLA